MPVEPVLILVPAVISKNAIALTAALGGHKNNSPLELAGKKYAAGAVRFACFAGAIDMADRLYKGEFRFEAGEFKDDPAGDLNQLFKTKIGENDGNAYL